MRLVLGTLLSFAGPITLGWLLVRALCPRGPSGLRFPLGTVLGMGLSGAAYYFALIVTRSSAVSFSVSEIVLAAGIAGLATVGAVSHRAFFAEDSNHADSNQKTRGQRPRLQSESPMLLALGATTVLAGAAALLTIATTPHGQWDAIAVWNLKARFIYHSPSDPLSRIMDPALWDTQPDYPLLLPSLVARGWQYAGQDSVIVPIGIAILFLVSTVLMVINGLKLLSSSFEAQLAGCLLLSTPFFIRHGVSQYADILMCGFITAAVVLFSIHDSQQIRSSRLPLLAGIAAGLAACTKNEGVLFVAVLAAVRALLQRSLRELGKLAAGAAFGIAVLVLFKIFYSPPNPIVHSITGRVVLDRIADGNYHAKILNAFAGKSLAFGQWWIPPFLLLLIHVMATRYTAPAKDNSRAWLTTAGVLVGALCGYYAVYLLSPYDLDWHIGTSLDRLLLQIWPTALLLYSMLTRDMT